MVVVAGPVSAALAYSFQKHAARVLHYDLRLELDGVLLSWAVPKGPSLATTDRRLAVRTDDHALDHLTFEGLTGKDGDPKRGAVIVWDRGSWEPEGDPREGLAKGKLTFVLHGEKLHGRYRLIRLLPDKEEDSDDKKNWLLIKGKDEHTRRGAEANITAIAPASVLTGRTLEQVKQGA